MRLVPGSNVAAEHEWSPRVTLRQAASPSRRRLEFQTFARSNVKIAGGRRAWFLVELRQGVTRAGFKT
jgi:hypothetical protein